MNKVIFLNLAFTLLLTACSNPSLVGKWVFIESSVALPQACDSQTLEFTDNGKLLIFNGSLESVMKYEKADNKDGMHFKLKRISDNGGTNCQGYSAQGSFGPANKPAYAEFIKGTSDLKLYFSEEAQGDYMLFRKSN